MLKGNQLFESVFLIEFEGLYAEQVTGSSLIVRKRNQVPDIFLVL